MLSHDNAIAVVGVAVRGFTFFVTLNNSLLNWIDLEF